jgi:hypothetical protein
VANNAAVRAWTRNKANKLHELTHFGFTDLGLARLNAKRLGDINAERKKQGLNPLKQVQLWDTGCRGLSLLLSSGGTKTFRATYKVNGKWKSAELGRFGEMVESDGDHDKNLQITEARRLTGNFRAAKKTGVDPRTTVTPANETSKSQLTYADVVRDFIERYAEPRQHTWDQTQRVLLSCTSLMDKPFADIKANDIEALLHEYTITERHGKATITYSWLRALFKWAFKGRVVDQNEMQRVRFEPSSGERERVYSDAEIKAIWTAADKLDPTEGGYVKLLILLAPRKTALALCEHSHLSLDDDMPVWTTPYELTKVKKSAQRKKRRRPYVTPLPPLAHRIFRGLPKRHDKLVFPGLRIRHSIADRPTLYGHAIRRQLITHGAPKDFAFHTTRHTMGTWFEDQKYSDWEIGLVLNHAGSGTVTGRYKHGVQGPLQIKFGMLSEWAKHVAKVVGLPPEAKRKRPDKRKRLAQRTGTGNVIPFRG